jgi:NADPH-dependent 2,4-dienoyl-CoA reductase/sulfur reductase-like enzyme/ferredoxin
MAAVDPAVFFANYTRRAALLPRGFWLAARVLVLLGTFGICALLVIQPPLGLLLWWRLIVPSLPLALVLAPGIWRQVCPMAFLNQAPRATKTSLGKELPGWLKNAAFGIAVAGFVGAVALRVPVLNQTGWAVAAGMMLVLALALLGGFVFKGRSGWCGTFCPLGPIQRVYGQAPPLVVKNGYCEPCLGCQKNCYDFNPRGAVFADMNDDDPRYTGQRRLFFGLLPGLILGYFAQGPHPAYGEPLHLTILLAACAASAGLYGLAITYFPLAPYRVAAVFTAASLIAFYYFSGPTILGAIAALSGHAVPLSAVNISRGIGIAASLPILGFGLYSEALFKAAKAPKTAPAATPMAMGGVAAPASRGGAPEVMDRGSGALFPVAAGATLLESIEKAGLKINFGCRAGLCGADPVIICDGNENLSPPSEDERSTLARLGLEGKARLACMCEVRGPVTIDRDPKSSGGPSTKPMAAPAIDRAKEIGLNRVVIIGNGVAGSTAAEKLRRASPSLKIDVVTNEPLHFYNRMAIGRVIYGRTGFDGLQLLPESWFEENNVEVWRNTVATGIDRAHKTVQLGTGEKLPYDKLVLATGARASTPMPDFLRRKNAFVLRAADDAQAVRNYVQSSGARRAVVLGGGVLGVEAADALHHLGLDVTLLQRADRLMNAQLDEQAGAKLTSYLEGIGIRIAVNSSVDRWEGEDAFHTAWLSHGPRIRADLFVACLGVSANLYLATQAGLDTGRSIKVDSAMRTSDPDIYAVGDVAEAVGPGGLWPVGAAQADAAVESILGSSKPYQIPRIVLQLKSEGIDIRSFGDLTAKPGDEVLTAQPEDTAWWRLIVRDGTLTGAVFAGPPQSAKHFTKVVKDNIDLRPARRALLLGDPTAFAQLC